MYSVITTFTKQDPDTPYYLDHVKEMKPAFFKFVEKNKSLIIEFLTADASDTVQISYALYENEEVFNKFIELFNEEFPTFFDDRDKYCLENNIQIDRQVETS